MSLAAIVHVAGLLLLSASAAYVVLCVVAMRRHRASGPAPAAVGGVTVLKPLCGDEPRLYEDLRSFCEQDHPDFQIVFGTREADDPALAVARRLQAEFPQRDIAVVVDPRVHGVNLKVSNLLNLMPSARHESIVLADSDILVAPDYLRRVTAPLADPGVGMVTCLYRGRPLGSLCSRLGAQFIDEWFRPSVRLSQLFGAGTFGFGATLALRRDALAAIGGLESVANLVADDYWLGERIAAAGLRTVLSDHEVVTDVVEDRLGTLSARELRWFRTIRSVRPGSYLGTAVCFTVPMVLAGLALAGFGAPAMALATLALAGRIILFLDSRASGPGREGWIAEGAAFLLRDSLSLLLWARALGGAKVSWRGQQIKLDTHAEMRTS